MVRIIKNEKEGQVVQIITGRNLKTSGRKQKVGMVGYVSAF